MTQVCAKLLTLQSSIVEPCSFRGQLVGQTMTGSAEVSLTGTDYRQSRTLRKLLWASNEQTGGLVFIYILSRSTHRTNPAFGCSKGPRQPCKGAVSRLPGLFLRGSQRESLRLENRSQQWHASLQPPEVLLSSRPRGNSSQTTACIHLPALLINPATSIN